MAKGSPVVRYLEWAFDLEGAFPPGERALAPIPEDLEREAAPATYRWMTGRTLGRLYLALLDDLPGTPLRAVDVAEVCAHDAEEILANVAAVCRGSFPLRGYPAPLLEAHRHACLSALECDWILSVAREITEAVVGAGDVRISGW